MSGAKRPIVYTDWRIQPLVGTEVVTPIEGLFTQVAACAPLEQKS
jgi:hypothetical protein